MPAPVFPRVPCDYRIHLVVRAISLILKLLEFLRCDVPVSPTLGSLSNDDADGNKNGKKAIGLISKTTTLHVHNAFFVHFFAVVARLQRESA